jgi:HEAT repeat protein
MQYKHDCTRKILGATCAAALLGLMPMTVTGQRASGLQAEAEVREAPPAAWLQQDPGDSIYRAGREALNRGQYREAVEHFRQLRGQYPQSGYSADAYYWEAFALDRLGSTDNLRSALQVLDEQARRYDDAATLKDAEILATRIRGRLAQRGDARAAERVARDAYRTSGVTVVGEVEGGVSSAGVQQGRTEDEELKMAALQALMMMDEERAVPLLIDLIREGEEISPELRAQAVMVLAQHGTPEAEEVLFDVLQNDPDPEVRGMTLMWLVQSSSDRALDAIESILGSTDDPELQNHAIMALAQQDSPRAQEMLRGVVQRNDLNDETRVMAIMMLGQHSSPENQDFLKDLYRTTESSEVKERIIHAMAMNNRAENQRWLLDIALRSDEPAETRKQALFMAGQTGAIPAADLIELYDGTDDQELRRHLMFVLAQQKDPAAIDKMIDIARNDPDREVRQQAIIWLAQSDDPRVKDLLVEIIKK